MQHSENLFRRFRGETVTIKTISGGIYEGRVSEVSNDWVRIIEGREEDTAQVFLFFNSIESVMVSESPTK
jgi:hypothetical protein